MPKIFRRAKSPQQPPFPADLKNCAFKLCAKTTMRRTDVQFTEFALDIIKGSVSLTTSASIAWTASPILKGYTSGFLTVGITKRGQLGWSLLWCVLSGQYLKMYPDQAHEENAMSTIEFDLGDCQGNVRIAEKTICARSKTLVLDVKESGAGNDKSIMRVFLQAESMSDLRMWKTDMNFVVHSVRMWRGAI